MKQTKLFFVFFFKQKYKKFTLNLHSTQWKRTNLPLLSELAGYFVNLVKENAVFSGEYDLLLEVADRQHTTSTHNLSVTVCACHNPAIPNCRQRSTSGSTASAAVIGVILAGLLLLAGRTFRLFNGQNTCNI